MSLLPATRARGSIARLQGFSSTEGETVSLMRSKSIVYLSALGLIWGASFLFIKVCIETTPLLTFIAGRMAMGATILYLVLRVRGEDMPRFGKMWLHFLVVGLLNALVPYGLIAWGEGRISSGLAAILNGTQPIFTVLLAHYVISDERLSLSKVVGIIVGFIGVVIVMSPDLGRGVTFNWLGQLAVLGASLSYASAMIYVRKNLRGAPAMKTAVGMLTSGCVLTLPLIILTENPLAIRPSLEAVGSWAALGVMGTAVAYLFYYWLIDNAGATYASLVTFTLPPLGVFWGAIILGEQVSWAALAGLVVIALSILAVNGYLDAPLARLVASRQSM
jgi:drug/metabolite transporter (DMT)-like permease